MHPDVQALYGNKIRVRVCGLCWQGDHLLMVNHRDVAEGAFWAPPGGGLEFGESSQERLEQEFLEETGFQISVGSFQFVCELVRKPLHAIELFFQVSITGGMLLKGQDPEMPIIDDVRFLSEAQLAAIPARHLHGVFAHVPSVRQLKTLNGFLRV